MYVPRRWYIDGVMSLLIVGCCLLAIFAGGLFLYQHKTSSLNIDVAAVNFSNLEDQKIQEIVTEIDNEKKNSIQSKKDNVKKKKKKDYGYYITFII